MDTVVRYGLILALIAHGLGHVMSFLSAWTTVPMGFTNSPWIFSQDVFITSPIGRLFGLFALAVVAVTAAAGIGALSGRPWWPTAAVIGAVLSLILILPWWNTFTPGSRLWAVLADVVILVALLPGWREQVIAFLAGS